MWPVFRRPQPPTPQTLTTQMREAFATPTKGRIVPEKITVWGPCGECGGDALWTCTQGTADKANLPLEVACPRCDPDLEAAAA